MIVNNNLLFSHTYLARLQADPSHDEAAAPIAQGLRDWMPFRDTSSLQALIDSWIGPVLDFLEFHHVPADDAPHIHLLYARRSDETPVGLCYVVPSGQDGSTGSPRGLNDTTKGQHPMAQAVLALRARNLRWGMLTDGARWRLVDAQALRRYEHYVEVDLDELARSDDPTPLRLFYALFHCSAFTSAHPPAGGGTEGDGESGLDRLVAASIRATKAAEDHLKALVSHNEGIMAQLCLGLVRADGRSCYTEAERDAIYRDATYLLYRILFILYAEARGLLPMDNPAYRAVSLAELVKTAHTYKLHGMPDPQATTLWERLKRLCNAIYESDSALGIPAYNGGLFDDADKPYLRNGHIADAYLTEALFGLAYRPDTSAPDGYQPLDYRDLSVRHLGSLYEGMIEYKLHIAEETLWARRDGKGNLRFLRKGQEGAPRKTDEEIKQDSVYFSQSPGERRATGTYYTPEYIVDYIVSQTVVRGLEERRAPLEEKLAGWLEEIQTSEVSETSEVSRMQRTADEELLRFVKEQVLTFRVCDPAMGSGHFLVNSAHQITNFIVETLHLTPWANEAADTDPVAWRRQVVERCLYGVDLSLMAVELAKLSLWLASVAEGKPLSFLDHHLRQGNSLIGARLEDLAEVLVGVASARPSRQERKAREAGQLSMLDDPAFSQHVTAATDLLAEISARVVERVEDVKAQEADYEQVRAELEPYRRLADLWTARHFGVDVDEQQLRAISEYLVNGAVSRVPEYERILTRTQELAHERSFFHWELEFPEVFLGQRGRLLENQSGFDVMVGNPPWGAELGKAERSYIQQRFESARGIVDSFALFTELCIRLATRQGLIGQILPDIVLLKAYPSIRQLMLDSSRILHAVHWGQPFPDAIIDACTLVLLKTDDPVLRTENEVTVIRDIKDFSTARWTADRITQRVWEELEGQRFNLYLTDRKQELKRKLDSNSHPFSELCHSHEGIHSGNIREKLFPFQQVSDQCYPLLFSGSELEPYLLTWQGRYVHYDPGIVDKVKGEYANLARPGYFLQPKILIQRTGDVVIAALDQERFYASNNFFVSQLHKPASSGYRYPFLVALLNSRLFTWYFHTIQPRVGRVFAELKIVHLDQFPVRRIRFSEDGDGRDHLFQKAADCYRNSDDETVLEILHHCSQPEQPHLDCIHDLLDYLANDMSRLKKLKRQETGRFLVWLERVLGVRIGDLSGKSLFQEYYRLQGGKVEFLDRLKRNKSKIIRLDIGTASAQDLIAREYERSVNSLEPLLARIAATDQLINQAVYRLYELSEDEIRVVEQSE